MLLDTAPQRKQLISLTPLIDVVFILLLFFMLSSTFSREKQIEITATGADSSQQAENKSHRLLLFKNGDVAVNDIRYVTESAEFTQMLEEFRTSGDNVTLSATQETPVQKMIVLLDYLRKAGISNLNLTETQAP